MSDFSSDERQKDIDLCEIEVDNMIMQSQIKKLKKVLNKHKSHCIHFEEKELKKMNDKQNESIEKMDEIIEGLKKKLHEEGSVLTILSEQREYIRKRIEYDTHEIQKLKEKLEKGFEALKKIDECTAQYRDKKYQQYNRIKEKIYSFKLENGFDHRQLRNGFLHNPIIPKTLNCRYVQMDSIQIQ